jgi:hypothetical protein
MEAKVYDSNTFSSVAFRVATGNVLLPPPKKKSSFPSPDKYKFDSSKYRPPLLYNLSISRLDNVEESVLEGAEEEDIMNPNSIQEDVVCTKFIFSVALSGCTTQAIQVSGLSPQSSRGLRSMGSTTVVLDKIVDSTPSTVLLYWINFKNKSLWKALIAEGSV